MTETETGFHLSDDDHGEANELEESQERLRGAQLKLSELVNLDGRLVTMTPQNISLLKSFVLAPEKADEFIKIVQICDFLDEDEANKELEAFYEAVRLGMATSYNIAHALSRAAINRKGAHNSSRVGVILDALSHTKFTTNQPRSKNGANVTNPRSPLA